MYAIKVKNRLVYVTCLDTGKKWSLSFGKDGRVSISSVVARVSPWYDYVGSAEQCRNYIDKAINNR